MTLYHGEVAGSKKYVEYFQSFFPKNQPNNFVFKTTRFISHQYGIASYF